VVGLTALGVVQGREGRGSGVIVEGGLCVGRLGVGGGGADVGSDMVVLAVFDDV
jgi:hypothetical protein